MRSAFVLILVFVALAAPVGQAALPTSAMFDRVAPSVVRVESRGCTGSGMGATERTATGFVWRDKDSIVTALHVVAGCSNIGVVYSVPSTLARSASVVKILRGADLALLSVSGAPTVAPLNLRAEPPSMDAKLEALGFPLHIPRMNSTTLSLRFGGSKLQDIVPPAVRESLEQNGSPDVQLEITNIEGHLLPGLSGAPILNSTGDVVAVGDGGLENGTVGISWGIPARMLPKLASSSDQASGSGTHPHNTALFAAETEAVAMGTVSCSGFVLTKVRTVSFNQLSATTDDPLGLQQLVSYFGVNPAAFSFDVYQQLESGATVTVPAGAILQPGGDGCDASIHGGDFVVHVSLASVNSLQEADMKATQLEQAAAGGPQGWMVDPQFTYLTPVQRFDGLVVRRRAYMHMNPALMYTGSPQDKYFFETMAARRSMLIDASAINNIANAQNRQRAMMCRMNSMLPNCGAENQRTDDWVRSVIAVHLSTFPVG